MGADVFLGLSKGNIVSGEMIKGDGSNTYSVCL